MSLPNCDAETNDSDLQAALSSSYGIGLQGRAGLPPLLNSYDVASLLQGSGRSPNPFLTNPGLLGNSTQSLLQGSKTMLSQGTGEMALANLHPSAGSLAGAASVLQSRHQSPITSPLYWPLNSSAEARLAEEGRNILFRQALASRTAAQAFSLQGLSDPLASVSLPALLPSAHDPITRDQGSALKALGSNLRSKADPYIDVAHVQEPESSAPRPRGRTRGGVSEPFPEKLHRMLKEAEDNKAEDVVSFFSHGRAFGVHDVDRFTAEIMPKYFKQSKWNSFARQLNLYGFQRISNGPDSGGYYHELFLKGRPNLCRHMRRVGVPQGEDRRKMKIKNAPPDPDFYTMKPIIQLDSNMNLPRKEAHS